jgi:hypothetical protein
LISGLEVFRFSGPELISWDLTTYFIKCTFDVVSLFVDGVSNCKPEFNADLKLLVRLVNKKKLFVRFKKRQLA